MIGVQRAVDLGDETLAERIVERAFDHAWVDAETGGEVAVDADHQLRARLFEIAGDVFETVQALEPGFELWRPLLELRHVDTLQRVLVLGSAQSSTDLDGLERQQISGDAGNLGELRPQPLDDLAFGGLALVPWSQADEYPAGVDARAAAAADRRSDRRHIRIIQHDRGRSLLQIGHPHKGDVRGSLGKA